MKTSELLADIKEYAYASCDPMMETVHFEVLDKAIAHFKEVESEENDDRN